MNYMIIRGLCSDTREYSELGSTNEELNRLLDLEDLEEGIVIRAGYQRTGKGYQGNSWLSEPDKNLLFSILLKPGSLHVENVFHISRIVSLSIIEVLDKQEIRAYIKWPNDIFTASGKICGILIENRIISDRISHSVIGVGLNVNQEDFNSSIPFPTSLFLEKECHFDMKTLLEDFRTALGSLYQALLSGNQERIMAEYLERLYLLGQPYRFSDGRSEFIASIKDVLPGGELELLLNDSEIRRYGFKEIEYMGPGSY
ncbi:biotin--[acetyl-CoA-carboxylase] ligase [Bacteroidota bacterium]